MENRSKGDLGIPASHSARLTNHLEPRWLLDPSGTTFWRHGIVICVISFSASLSLKIKWFTESLGKGRAPSHGRVGWRHSRSGPLMFGSCPCPYFHGGPRGLDHVTQRNRRRNLLQGQPASAQVGERSRRCRFNVACRSSVKITNNNRIHTIN